MCICICLCIHVYVYIYIYIYIYTSIYDPIVHLFVYMFISFMYIAAYTRVSGVIYFPSKHVVHGMLDFPLFMHAVSF